MRTELVFLFFTLLGCSIGMAEETESEMIMYGTKMKLTIKVQELESKCFESPAFMLNSLKWKVRFCKGFGKCDDQTVQNVNISLVALYDENNEHISYKTRGNFKLIPMDGDANKAKLFSITKLFSVDSPIHGTDLINFDDFETSYVMENKCSLEVEIAVSPKYIDFDVNNLHRRFRIVINNVKDLGRYSSPKMIKMQGATWNVHVQRKQEKLAVYVIRVNSDLDLYQWSWQVYFSIKLLPVDRSAEAIFFEHSAISQYDRHFGYRDIICFQEFLNRYATKTNKAIFEIVLMIDKPIPLWHVKQECEQPENVGSDEEYGDYDPDIPDNSQEGGSHATGREDTVKINEPDGRNASVIIDNTSDEAQDTEDHPADDYDDAPDNSNEGP